MFERNVKTYKTLHYFTFKDFAFTQIQLVEQMFKTEDELVWELNYLNI